ncbi:MAG: CPBP family intramembrane metalloprotease [Chloroflexi bacterium]|nr:CPBP family intramembrane metalloprotease [Chloroflexota bacterium]
MKNRTLLHYAVLPPIILNVWAIILYLPYYMLVYTESDLVRNISAGDVTFVSYIGVLLVEWAFVISILRRLKRDAVPLRQMLAPEGSLLSFRPLPALATILGVNVLFALYFLGLTQLYGDTLSSAYAGIALWQRIAIIVLVPVSAAFCEELIWRAYIPDLMAARQAGFWRIIVLSSLSFALIHGIFFVDKLLVTFVFGGLLAFYVLKERNLVPAMAGHWLVNLWSFGLYLFW